MAIQNRRGNEANFNAGKLLPGEFAVSLDKQKVRIGFGSGKTKELASVDDVNDKIAEFKNTVDGEIAEAVAEVEEAGQRVLATIPSDYTKTAQKADEAIRTKASAITCEAEGESIAVSDSSGDYIRNLRIYGRTEQATTTGKNKFDLTIKSGTTDGVTLVNNGNGTATVNGSNANNYVQFVLGKISLPKGIYKISGNSNTSCELYLSGFSESYDTGSGAVFTITEDIIDRSVFYYIPKGIVVNNLIKPMIRLASIEDDTHEPYTGGAPSPSMEYPQEMVNAFEGMENLIKFSLDTEKTVSGLKFTPSDNDLIVNGTHNGGGIWLEIGAGKLTAGETYTLSSAIDISIHLYDGTNDKEYVTKPAGTASIVVTPNESISCAVVINNVNAQKTYANYKVSAMLNKGTTALPYRPYGHNVRTEVLASNLFGGDALADKLVAIGGTKDSANGTVSYAGKTVDGKLPIYDNFKPNTQYTIILNGFCTIEKLVNMQVSYTDGSRTGGLLFGNNGILRYVTLQNKTVKALEGYWSDGTTTLHYDKCGIFESVKTLDDFEPYTQQTLTHSIPGGLAGIPVTDAALATYTDANGNMYCADYVDFDTGEYVQRCGNWYFTGDERWTEYNSTDSILRVWTNVLDTIAPNNSPAYCSHFINFNGLKTGCFYIYLDNGKTAFCIDKAIFPSVDSWKAKLAEQYANGTPVTVTYLLDTPIRHPLTQEEIDAFKQLHTNYPHTTILNDAGAWMQVEYNADTKTWLLNQIAEICTAIING